MAVYFYNAHVEHGFSQGLKTTEVSGVFEGPTVNTDNYVEFIKALRDKIEDVSPKLTIKNFHLKCLNKL